jgi:outer membrane protein assembly factor BamE
VPRGFRIDRIDTMRWLVPLLLPLLLAGCFLVPHKIEVQQGNVVDRKMVEKLKLDMTRSQVRFVMGTPLIADPFHPDRWDYVYLSGKAGDVRSLSRITVVFEDDKLRRLEGDAVPFEIQALRSTPEQPAAMTKAVTDAARGNP